MTPGEKLKLLRKENMLTLHDVSLETLIDIGTLSKIESGIFGLNQTNLTNLANFYGVSADYILGTDVYILDNFQIGDMIHFNDINQVVHVYKSISNGYIRDQYPSINVRKDFNPYIVFQVKDDTMLNKKITRNDIVFVDTTAKIKNNDICLVMYKSEPYIRIINIDNQVLKFAKDDDDPDNITFVTLNRLIDDNTVVIGKVSIVMHYETINHYLDSNYEIIVLD
ncbi:helix-turn-helix domain-containing protein [Paracholeplasma manati]|uniref:Helix-turn-helix domain-containing protein n=1 Tax=Paracholeplasma manati TaxID=591373 RepID=A0ABT2Y5A5_9MOLU|nr:helix-turn-helix domain-containing protein [Paracholeplasma manati]MCV2231927.1 helix-turn-helix domain-containing protein [Paracholeplasma manati]MDG0888920.1 helix-turn-helix domain-containing protein [Paracholeplasma manati]